MNGPTVSYGNIVFQSGYFAQLGSNVVIGSADFDGDNKSDLLLRDATTGQVSVWKMDGTTVVSSTTLATVDSSWTFLGTAGFNADVKSDMLWRQAGTGLIAEWHLGA